MIHTNLVSIIRKICITIICATSLVGCTFRVADLTLVSTKNIDLTNVSVDPKKGERVEAQDCVYSILGIIPLGIPNLENAVDAALEKGHGNLLTDQVTYRQSLYFILFGRSCIKVEGTVLNVKSNIK